MAIDYGVTLRASVHSLQKFLLMPNGYNSVSLVQKGGTDYLMIFQVIQTQASCT